MKITNLRLGVCMPSNFPMIFTDVLDSFVRVKRAGGFVWIRPQFNDSICELRNAGVRQAQDMGCTHLLMFDADMCLHRDTMVKLVKNDKDICGALAFQRYPPFHPVMFKRYSGNWNGELDKLSYEIIIKWEKETLVEVDAVGTGVVMINMNVFDGMEEPYFERIFKTVKDGKEVFFGEDISFCIKAKRAGYRIFMDTSIPAGHVTKMNVKEEDFRLAKWMEVENKRIKSEEGVKCREKEAENQDGSI